MSRSFQTHAFCEPSRPLAGVRAASAWHEERHTRARSLHRQPRRQVLTMAIVCCHRSESAADLSVADLSRRHHGLEVFLVWPASRSWARSHAMPTNDESVRRPRSSATGRIGVCRQRGVLICATAAAPAPRQSSGHPPAYRAAWLFAFHRAPPRPTAPLTGHRRTVPGHTVQCVTRQPKWPSALLILRSTLASASV